MDLVTSGVVAAAIGSLAGRAASRAVVEAQERSERAFTPTEHDQAMYEKGVYETLSMLGTLTGFAGFIAITVGGLRMLKKKH